MENWNSKKLVIELYLSRYEVLFLKPVLIRRLELEKFTHFSTHVVSTAVYNSLYLML